MYSPKAVADAEAQLARLQALPEDEVNDVQVATKKKILRGGKLVVWLQSESSCRELSVSLALNVPLQHYLNHLFAGESSVASVVAAYRFDASDPELEAKEQKAIMSNLSVLNGDRGRKVVADFSSLLLNFSSAGWQGLGLSPVDKFDASLCMLVAMSEAWWRLVFKFDQPKYQLFNVCRFPQYSELVVRSIANALLDKHAACPECVDPYFTEVWCRRLTSTASGCARNAHQVLRSQLATLSVLTTKCERKHLLGQEVGTIK